MPRKKQPPATPAIAKARPQKPQIVPLELKDRTRLMALLDDPIFQKAWTNAQMSKPSPFAGGLNTALGDRIATNRLHELRGWMMFEAALLRQCEDPKVGRKTPEDNYPDSGLPGALH